MGRVWRSPPRSWARAPRARWPRRLAPWGAMQMWPGRPYPLGATYDGTGTNFALFSEVAERVELCLIADGRHRDPRRPDRGRRVRVARLPARASRPGSATATGCTGRTTRRRATAATRTSCCSTRTPRRSTGRSTATRRCTRTSSTTRTQRNDDDSAAHTMTSVVINPYFDWGHDRPPQHEYHESVIYEAHVRGLTMQHPAVPEELRGTYAGLAHPAVIEHLTSLGVTAVELMPVHQFVNDPSLVEQGPVELLGLQHHRVLRAAQRLRGVPAAPGSRCRSSRRWSRRCTRRTSR